VHCSNIEATGGKIATWDINGTHLMADSDDFIVRLSRPIILDKEDTPNSDIDKSTVLVVGGKKLANGEREGYPFYLRSSGFLHCSNIEATGGTIGGWKIDKNMLYASSETNISNNSTKK
jgi:hypothetical protein